MRGPAGTSAVSVTWPFGAELYGVSEWAESSMVRPSLALSA